MPPSSSLMNCDFVWIFASGNFASACWRRAVFASVTPPLTFTNEKRSCGFAYSRSNRVVEIVTSPNGEPPFGGSKMPRSFIRNTAPVGVVRSIGEPTCSSLSFAKAFATNAPSCPSCPGVAGLPSFHLRSMTLLTFGSTR